jgi:hypothetical protein
MDEDAVAISDRAAARRRSSGGRTRGARSFALSAVAVLAMSFAIAWPLWLAATEARGAFNAAFAALVLAAVAWAIVARARSRAARAGSRAARAGSRTTRGKSRSRAAKRSEGEAR